MTAAIELREVCFTYPNGHQANLDLNLRVEPGERLAIVGQNGAGKTTAVKLMNNLLQPTSGTVLVSGEETWGRTTAQVALKVGYVFQNPDDQIFNRDVKSEIEYMPRYLKLERAEIERRVARALEMTGIEKYLGTNPFDIPYAIRKFVSIAAVLAMETPCVILDEPTAGQDRRGIRVLRELMDRLRDEGRTVIAITHDMEFVAENFRRTVAMAQKRIIFDGATRDLFRDDAVLAASRIKRPQVGQLARDLGNTDGLLLVGETADWLLGGTSHA